MPDLRQYWQEVRAIERTLAAFEWLMSLDHPARGQKAGCLVEVAAHAAARLLQAKTHRLATAEEIEAHHAKEDEENRHAFQARLRRQGISVVPVRRKS